MSAVVADPAATRAFHAEREVSARETLARIVPFLGACGVTRVCDITRLDRLGIPVVNAIAPRSNDEISVYNGKGLTMPLAITSAVMEAVERFSAALPRSPDLVASVDALRAEGRAYIDPDRVCLEPAPRYRSDLPISWLRGTRLVSGEAVLVPQFVSSYHTTYHEYPTHRIATTNGLASGNSVEEATFHALAEVIERDAWTRAEITARLLPSAVRGLTTEDRRTALSDRFPLLVPGAEEAPVVRELLDAFASASVGIVLRDLSAGTAVATVLAIAVERGGVPVSAGHFGLGTHPSGTIAVLRALTEVAQSRAVDISAVREDITTAAEDVEPWLRHVQRADGVNETTWPARRDQGARPLSSLPESSSGKVGDDLAVLSTWLADQGLHDGAVVDLSPPEIPASVVRVVVPGAESWVVDKSRLGSRALTWWNTAVGEVARA